jgi:hypothetical protein
MFYFLKNKMSHIKYRAVAFFFLVCFTGCIGVNAVRNFNILMQCNCKTQIEVPSSLLTVKINNVDSVYFLMDKKEEKVQKYPDAYLIPSVFPLRSYAFRIVYPVHKSTGSDHCTTPVYMEVHNYRI